MLVRNRRAVSVPTFGGTLFIDWTNPITRGLLFCYVPGIMGGVDVAHMSINLVSQGSGTQTASSRGPGWQSTTSNSGLAATTPDYLKNRNAMTMFWHGIALGAPVGGSGYISMTYDNVNSSPFDYYSMRQNGGATFFQGRSGNGGAYAVNGGAVPTTAGTAFSVGWTAIVNGNALCYNDGVQSGSFGFLTTTPPSTSTSLLAIGVSAADATLHVNAITTVAAFWSRVLSANEMRMMHFDPFCFIAPSIWTTVCGIVVQPAVNLFRRSSCQ